MMPYIEVVIDPDGVNGDIEVLRAPALVNVRVIVTRGPEREVVFDSDPEEDEVS